LPNKKKPPKGKSKEENSDICSSPGEGAETNRTSKVKSQKQILKAIIPIPADQAKEMIEKEI